MTTPGALPLLIDCDTGIDDSLALLYACASPDADIRAVTCVAGNVDATQVGINTRAVLELAGRPDIEVALGREVPLMRTLVTTPETHGPQGLGDAVLPAPTRPLSARHAADLIIAEARAHPGELTLVTLGPMTNLAVAVLREPRCHACCDGWCSWAAHMARPATRRPSRSGTWPSIRRRWPWCSGRGPRMVPWPGATNRRLVRWPSVSTSPSRPASCREHLERLAARAGCRRRRLTTRRVGPTNPVIRYLADALAFYFRFHERFDGFTGAFIHDPLALAAALDPDLVQTRPVTVEVELGGALTAGQTVADWRHHWDRPPNLDVAVIGGRGRLPGPVHRTRRRAGGASGPAWHASTPRPARATREGRPVSQTWTRVTGGGIAACPDARLVAPSAAFGGFSAVRRKSTRVRGGTRHGRQLVRAHPRRGASVVGFLVYAAIEYAQTGRSTPSRASSTPAPSC